MIKRIYHTCVHTKLRVLLVTLVFCCPFTFAKSAVTPIGVQAALIKNFTHLITWPKNDQRNAGPTFNICVYNSDSLLEQFENIFSGKVIKGKATTIININSSDLSNCDLAYVAGPSDKPIKSLLASAQALGVLTISSSNGYGEQGVHINFFERGNNIAFELNKKTLDNAGFEVSTQLFRYAKIVQ
ncbi:YfiR family protein [Alkalimarinus sediminis]|uniref:YfiR family protein n=1 Tax=Alkalimarinus sediminis TaxID=1632866 RepID=A0A9E8HIH9_9ALTE|nr:YfiR family protein [Alkalimarinus sediminis]UZW73336.1 YfiR family protein [Alkalimarinus sediminis]